MTTDAPTPAFEKLDALAYVEVDRYCDKCAYNLRGQAVRRDAASQLPLIRCPECGTFHAANGAASALTPLWHRVNGLLMGLWVMLCLYLLILAIIGQTALMASSLEELGRLVPRNFYHHDYGYDNERNQMMDERLREERLIYRSLAIGGSAAIGLVAAMLWTVIFPHWPRWVYRLFAFVLPAVAMVTVSLMIHFEGVRWVPDDAMLMLGLMFGAHGVAGLLGSVLGRPAARMVLGVVLPARQRATFDYLWMVDGRKPPHGAAATQRE